MQIYHNGTLFYDDNITADEYKLTSAKVSLSVGSAGSFTFSVPPCNLMYDGFTKLKSYIDVYRENDLIFSGRVIDEYKDYAGIQKITCEGLLAVFNDSYFAPATYASITLSDLVEEILTSHNSQVSSDKQVQLGNITVTDDYVYRAYENYELSVDRFKDLVDSYGGYMSVRKENNQLYLDWIAEFTDYASQSIDFGRNLIDLNQDSSASEIVTVLLPLGAEIEDEQGNRHILTIESVNDGSVTIEDEDGIEEFGRIVGIQTWDDVAIPANLLAKARAYLNDKSRSRVTINAKAVDMAKAGSSVEAFKIGERVKVSAELFGVDAYFVVMSQNLDLMNPASNQMTLGDKIVGYVSKTNSAQTAISNAVGRISSSYATNQRVNDVVDRQYQIITENYITENAANDLVSRSVGELQKKVYGDDETVGDITRLETTMNQTAESIQFITKNESQYKKMASTFSFEGNTFKIETEGAEIHSEQGANFYKYVDTADNIVFAIDKNGTTAAQANVIGQVGIGTGSVEEYNEQWAIRKGNYDSTINGYDLDFVWVGGN